MNSTASEITFCLVINPEDDNINEQGEYIDTLAAEVKERAETYSANFKIRPYHPWNNHYDRDNIERLPAIHIYKRNIPVDTFYLDDEPIQHVDKYMNHYLRKKKAKVKSKSGPWLAAFKNFVRFIRVGVSKR
jgi:hypothetical protein